MANPRDELAATFAALQDNAYWRQYVSTLRKRYADTVRQLVLSPAPDECLRGKAAAYYDLIQVIESNQPKAPT